MIVTAPSLSPGMLGKYWSGFAPFLLTTGRHCGGPVGREKLARATLTTVGERILRSSKVTNWVCELSNSVQNGSGPVENPLRRRTVRSDRLCPKCTAQRKNPSRRNSSQSGPERSFHVDGWIAVWTDVPMLLAPTVPGFGKG